MSSDWPFPDPLHSVCITTKFVLDGSQPVRLVIHDDDDDDEDGIGWQILCGSTDNPEDGRASGLKELLTLCPDIAAVADLPIGWHAWRDSPDEDWERISATE